MNRAASSPRNEDYPQQPDSEQATVCAIETFAEHWTEAQAFSVATLAACAITAMETANIDTLPWKHTFLRSLFRQLGIHSREEQEMLLSLQETGSYQDCNLQVLAEPLLPRVYQRGSSSHSRRSSNVSTPISSPPASPTRTRKSLQQQRQYHGGESACSPPLSPSAGSFLARGMDSLQLEDECDIRNEVINDLLYIGLGFEPSSRSRKTKKEAEQLQLVIPQDPQDAPPQYSEKDSRPTQYPTDAKDEYSGNTSQSNPDLPPQNEHTSPPLPPRMSSEVSTASSGTSSSQSSTVKKQGRVQPLEYDARARAVIFSMCNYLLLSYDSFMIIEKQIAQHLYFYQQELIEAERAEKEHERLLKERQQQEHQQKHGGGVGGVVGGFFSNLRKSEQPNKQIQNHHGQAMQTQAQTSMQELEKKKKTWRYVATGLSIAAGATVIGLTGGLAAPLVAAGAGVLIGSGAAVLGSTAGIAVMTSLFGLAGGGLAGYKVHRRNKDLKVLSFVPIVKDPTLPAIPSLHLAIVISGYLFDENDVTEAWHYAAEHALNGSDVFHMTFEPADLVTLGNAVKVFLTTEAVRMVSTQVISQTVFAALASALVLPFGLMRAGDLIDNPWVVAMDRARKAGYVLADILMERVQGARPTTLIGYSTGAVVIWECLLELAKRKEHGLVNSVVLLGAPIKTDQVTQWKAASSVVSHRFVNGYSKKDVVLGAIFRLHSLGLDVAGLRPVDAVSRIENVDLTDIVGGHLEYRENLNMVISLLGVL